jgi:DNA-binding CsgD family transcriptional regulator
LHALSVITSVEACRLALIDRGLGGRFGDPAALARVRRELAALRRGVDALGQAMVVLTKGHRVSAMTPRAAHLIRTYVAPMRGHRLPEVMERWLLAEGRRVPAAIDMPRRPLLVERAGTCLVARLVWHPGHLLLLLHEDATQSVDPRRLAVLGLSRREAEVLAWVAEGKTNGDIATILGTSVRTVEKHLEHVFRKLGVENRTAAMARALAAGARTA